MNRQVTKPLRRCDSRSMTSLKSDPQFRSMIRSELKDMINRSVHEYLQNHKIPVASIDIQLDKDCKNCVPVSSHREQSPSNIRLNISTSSMDHQVNTPKEPERPTVKKPEDDNVHWMTWTDPTPFFTKKKDLKNFRMQTAKNPSFREHRCQSPFIRPSTSFQNKTNMNGYNDHLSLQYRPPTGETTKRERCMSFTQTHQQPLQKMSIAVGPDKQFQTTATNTQKTYQISDYLKKSLNLNDPYERQVFCSMMEVLRKKNRSNKFIDTESVAADPIIQLSEYKSKFKNPSNKSINFPTASLENRITSIRPPTCPHKTRPLGQLRPSSSYNNGLGEQYLY